MNATVDQQLLLAVAVRLGNEFVRFREGIVRIRTVRLLPAEEPQGDGKGERAPKEQNRHVRRNRHQPRAAQHH